MHGNADIFTKDGMNRLQTITSLEVAEMVGKQHKELLRDIRTYIEYLNQANEEMEELGERKIALTDFFVESTYLSEQNKILPCYDITRKGCEYIATKLIGVKGAIFTAKYINRFHDMEGYIKRKEKPSLDTINDTINIFFELEKRAGCSEEIQLLTAKTIFEEFTGKDLPLMIKADKQYHDAEYIARKVGIYVQSSGKPAEKAVNEIIRRLDVSEDMYTETWEANGKWQGTVRKYSDDVIKMVLDWCEENGYPNDIEYVQSDGKKKKYHVKWKNAA